MQSVANLVNECHEEVEYFIFCGDVDLNGAALENIEINKWVHYNDHTKVWYNGPDKISDNLVDQVEKIVPDVLYITGMFSWHFNIVPMVYCKAPKKILSTRGMLHPGALSQKKWKKKVYLQLFKLLEYHHKMIFHASDKAEEKFIRNYFGEPAQIVTASNFPNKIGEAPMLYKERGSLRLITITLISPVKNILHVLRALENITGDIQYDIYGAIKDEDYWDECKAQIKKLPSNIKVIVHKEIEPSKVKEALQNAHVFILPSKSENFGHALYEALSAGRPVITSHHTPWNCLQSSFAGMNVSLDGLAELSAAINFFVSMDMETLTLWHQGAIAYAETAIDVDVIRRDYELLFRG